MCIVKVVEKLRELKFKGIVADIIRKQEVVIDVHEQAKLLRQVADDLEARSEAYLWS